MVAAKPSFIMTLLEFGPQDIRLGCPTSTPSITMPPRQSSYYSILLLSYLPTVLSTTQCYFPDGTIPTTLSGQPDYQPCNTTTPTANGASACCQLSTSTCTTTGYCNLNNGYTYRGACTDPSFPQPCAQGCLNGKKESGDVARVRDINPSF